MTEPVGNILRGTNLTRSPEQREGLRLVRKKFWAVLLLVSFFPCLAFAVQNPADAQTLFEQAVQFKAAQDFDQAEQMLREATQLDPTNPDYHFELANLYALRYDLLKGSTEDLHAESILHTCVTELEQTLTYRPEDLAALYNLGVVYKNLEEYEKARDEFRRVLERDPHQMHAYFQIAATYEAQGFFDEARDAYEQAQEIDPEHPDLEYAFQELKRKEMEAENQSSLRYQMERMSQWGNRRLPAGQAAQYYHETRGADPEAGQSVGALPYLGALLAQEFMKKRGVE